MYTNLKTLMEKGSLILIDDEKLVSQLNSYTYEFTDSGQLKIIKSETSHDDVPDALALAVYGSSERRLVMYSWR